MHDGSRRVDLKYRLVSLYFPYSKCGIGLSSKACPHALDGSRTKNRRRSASRLIGCNRTAVLVLTGNLPAIGKYEPLIFTSWIRTKRSRPSSPLTRGIGFA